MAEVDAKAQALVAKACGWVASNPDTWAKLRRICYRLMLEGHVIQRDNVYTLDVPERHDRERGQRVQARPQPVERAVPLHGAAAPLHAGRRELPPHAGGLRGPGGHGGRPVVGPAVSPPPR